MSLPPRKDKNRVPRAKRELKAAAPKEAERIAKVIARAGLGSRREIEEWILEGRVAVNGEVLTSPAFTVTAADAITVDGEPLPERERTRLFIYHKPRGVVTTNRDPEGRTTLFEILPKGLPRLVSVGRLDLNSEGLLLLTNDGGLARVLELPETGWLRRYRVRANGEIDQARLDTLLSGITVEGVEYGPIEAVLDRQQGANAWITVALREGKNREVRNVLGALGLKVNRLIRVSYGPFQLGEIAEGAVEEVRTRVLRDQIGDEIAAAAGADFTGLLVERELEEAPHPAPRPAGRRQALADAPPARKGDRLGDRFGDGRDAGPGAKPRRPREEAFQDQFRDAPPRSRRRDEDREVEKVGTVADRKGRTVKVERVVAPPRDEQRPRRFEDGSRRGPGGLRKRAEGEGFHRRSEFDRGDFGDERRAPPGRRGPPREAGGPDEARRGRGFGAKGPGRPGFEKKGFGDRGRGAEPEGRRFSRDEDARPRGGFRERPERGGFGGEGAGRPSRGPREEAPRGRRDFDEAPRSRGPRREEGPWQERGPRREDGDRPFRQRPGSEGGFAGRGPREEAPRSRGPRREEGDRSFRPRPGSEGGAEGRGPRREGGDRPFRQRSGAEGGFEGRGPRREEGGRPFRQRPGSEGGAEGRGPRREGGDRPFRQRGGAEGGFEGRGPRRDEGFRQERGPRREEGDRPFRPRQGSGGGFEGRGPRPSGEDFGSRPARPAGKGGGKPFGAKGGAGGGKSFGNKSFGDRPAGAKGFGGKSFGGKGPGKGPGVPRGGKPGGKPGFGKGGGAGGSGRGGKPAGRPRS